MLIFITQQVVALKEKGDMSMQLYNEQILNRMLDYIKQYQTENGKSPTYRLIGKSVGIENPGYCCKIYQSAENQRSYRQR